MTDDALAVRTRHFKAHWSTWVALHHFLSASLLRELVIVVVEEVSGGELTFQQLFEDSVTTGIDCLEAWLIRPLERPSPLGQYLQNFIRALAWQNDAPIPPASFAASNSKSVKTLETAVRIGTADFSWFSPSMGEYIDQPSLDIIPGIRSAAESFQSSSTHDFLNILTATMEPIEAPLDAVAIKHLGDLCADSDSWDKALALYTEAARRVSQPHAPAWNNLLASLEAITSQSVAAAERNLRGPAQAAARLVGIISSATMHGEPLVITNGSLDALTATMAAASMLPVIEDRRPVVLSSPLLQVTHDGADALRSWRNGDFRDAYRQFWAAIRRQISLGSSTESRTLKALYARSLIDELVRNAATQKEPTAFRLAIGLLLESGISSEVVQIPWSETLIGMYVDQFCVNFVISHAGAHPGVQIERQSVAVELFGSWATFIGLESASLANFMLRYVAGLALTAPSSLYTPANLGGRSLQILREIAQKRPELRIDVRSEVSAAVISKLKTAEFWTGRAAALETAATYIDSFSCEQVEAVIGGTLTLLDGISSTAPAWPLVGPALELLVAAPTKRLAGQTPDLGGRILATILRFGLLQEGGIARVLFYLRNFDATLLRNTAIAQQLQGTVAGLRHRAQEANSSSVVENIQALLMAPLVSGAEGVKDAIAGLDRVLGSVSEDRPSIGLPFAYSPLLLLAEQQAQIATDLTLSVDAFRHWLHPICNRVIELWNVGKDRPLLFSMFALPTPTVPDPVIIHNWAFASIVFAESLGEKDRVQEALSRAMAQPALADSIALARATRSTSGNEDVFDAGAIRSEHRETFYSALGRRLVVLHTLDDERAREICKALLYQCIRLGPRSIDAAVLLAAYRLNIGEYVDINDYSNYVTRLQENDRELRLSLSPIIETLRSGRK